MPAERIKNLHLTGADNRLSGANGKLTADAGTTVDLSAATVLLPAGAASGLPGGGTAGQVLTVLAGGTLGWVTPSGGTGGGGGTGATPTVATGTPFSSSDYNATYAKGRAFDHDPATAWNSQVAAAGEFIGLDLVTPRQVVSARAFPLSPTFAARLAGAVFQGSASMSGPWTNLGTITSSPAGSDWSSVSVTDAGTYRFVRLYFVVNDYAVVAEVEFTVLV